MNLRETWKASVISATVWLVAGGMYHNDSFEMQGSNQGTGKSGTG